MKKNRVVSILHEYELWITIIVADSISGNGGGELMAYNPAPSLLDFDDDIFLGATTSSPVTNSANDVSSSNLYASDPLDLEDNKTSLLESYVGSNENNNS